MRRPGGGCTRKSFCISPDYRTRLEVMAWPAKDKQKGRSDRGTLVSSQSRVSYSLQTRLALSYQSPARRCSLSLCTDRPLTARRATVGVAVENGERGPCSGAIGHCPLLPRVPLVWGRRVGDTGRSHAIHVACAGSIIAFGQGVWNRRYDGDSQGE